jgi:tetratricopeptide (TPR) repeat protein
MVGMTLFLSGRPALALKDFERSSDQDDILIGRALTYYALGRKADADEELRKMTLRFSSSYAFGLAEIHAYRGEVDQAFYWLDRAYEQRNTGCSLVGVDPLLKNLHGDPRFNAFLKKMNLPVLR